MPSVVPKIYLTHPIRISEVGYEEGIVPQIAVNEGAIVPVLVLGPEPPAVGAIVEAHRIGTTWVTGKGHDGSSSYIVLTNRCTAVGICEMRSDLTLHGTFNLFYAFGPGGVPLRAIGTATLTYEESIANPYNPIQIFSKVWYGETFNSDSTRIYQVTARLTETTSCVFTVRIYNASTHQAIGQAFIFIVTTNCNPFLGESIGGFPPDMAVCSE